jgi:hypothetical protein
LSRDIWHQHLSASQRVEEGRPLERRKRLRPPRRPKFGQNF